MASLRRINGEVTKMEGVCAGIAYYLGIPVWLIRIIFIFTAPVSIMLYLIFWFILSERLQPKDFYKETENDEDECY